MYYEDVDLCRRLRTGGRIAVRLIHGPGVVHRGGASRASSALQRRSHDRSQDYYLQKAGSPFLARVLVRGARFAFRRTQRAAAAPVQDGAP
jgi:GT2 family glycosyltransferase